MASHQPHVIRVRIDEEPSHIFPRPAISDQDEPDSPIEPETRQSEDNIDAFQSLKSRPEAARSVTDPPPSALLQGYFGSASSRPSSSHRNRSPYSRSHLRSRSTGAALNAPAMTRAHSSPSVHTSASRAFELSTPSTGSLSPGSPMRSPARPRSPLKAVEESGYNPPPRSPSWFDAGSGSAIESIQEDSELSITPRQPVPGPSPMPLFARSSSLRRRPASPLHSSTPPTSYPTTSIEQNVPLGVSVAVSSSNSPSLGPQRFNEAYPPLHHYASSSSFSSIPSTPTSQRSRSPSISSLDTIEDAPDLESEAIEAERIERLKLAAERAERSERGEDVDDNVPRRSSLDAPRGFGFSRTGNRERKRWSVCGGERRADLDLETIWED